MESTIPVQSDVGSGENEPVDLSLEREGDYYLPANPLTATELPATAAAPIELEGGIGIGLASSTEHEAQSLGEMNLFYPETAQTTDSLVAPIAGGVAVFEQLRSPESPEEFRYPVFLPNDASLRPTDDGGAEVVSGDGDVIVEVLAPAATDAHGERVPVSARVEGDEFVVDIPHNSNDYTYPLILDPHYVQDTWPAFNGFWHLNDEHGPYWLTNWGSALSAGSRVNQAHSSENYSQWEYTPPNSTAFIEAATFSNITFLMGNGSCQKASPFGYVGIWNVYSGAYQPYAGTYSGVGISEVHANDFQTGWVGGWGTRKAIVGIGGASPPLNCQHELWVGGVTVQQNDLENPVIWAVSGIPSGWFKGPSVPQASITAYDPGFGISSVRMTETAGPETFGPPSVHTVGCSGTINSRCPEWRGWNLVPPYQYGKWKLVVTAEDPTGKVGLWETTTKYDPWKPDINLDGQLAVATKQAGTEQLPQEVGPNDRDELSMPVYNLKVLAADGSPGWGPNEQSGVKSVEVLLDGQKVSGGQLTNPSPCDNCSLGGTIPIGLTDLNPGAVHKLVVIVKDQIENERKREIEFEYIPATGMKEEYVLQHFPLDDGQSHEGEAVYHGPELLVNVVNGNLVKWYVIRPPKNDYVRIGTTAQWCPGNGEPRPVIDSVLERDTPRAVILTARLAHQAGKLCASVNLPVEHVVLLKRRLGSRPLYDGSQRPPVRRWPRRGRSAAGSELNEGVPRWPTAPLLSTPF